MLRLAITDRRLALASTPSTTLLARCAALAREGIDFLLIREKDLPAGELVQLCRTLRAAVRQHAPHTRILVASRPDIALAAQLDGVHLSSHPGELTPTQVRLLFRRTARPAPFVTLSCHTLEDIRRARHAEASAALFAPVFGKTVFGKTVFGKTVFGKTVSEEQVTPPAGLQALRAACHEAAPMPVFALGGVTHENAPQCLQAGAAGIAAIRLFMNPESPNHPWEPPCHPVPSVFILPSRK